MTWITSNRAKKIDYLAPTVEQIDPYDIADGLSSAIRFRGLTTGQLTVAQHSVLASKLCTTHPLEALLHDAHEAYTGDVPTPLKQLLGDAWYEIEFRLQTVICEKYGIQPQMPPEVHRVDQLLLATERRDLQPRGVAWDRELPEPHSMKIVVWPAHQAKEVFLVRFKELMAVHRAAVGS